MDEVEALKKQLRQTQLAYQMATQIALFKSGFIGRIGHELRSPLSSLMSLHQLILSDLCEDPQEEREFIAQAYQSAQKLLKIIDEIVAVSKIDYGTIDLVLEPVQLAEVFAELTQVTYLQAANRNLSLEIVSPPPEFYVKADFHRLLQGLLFLVDTAVREVESGTIEVSSALSGEGDRLVISLECDCPSDIWCHPLPVSQPIDPLNRREIETLSQKVEMSPSLKFVLVQTLLEAMGGSVEMQQVSPEISTRIRCWLPRIAAETVDRE